MGFYYSCASSDIATHDQDLTSSIGHRTKRLGAISPLGCPSNDTHQSAFSPTVPNATNRGGPLNFFECIRRVCSGCCCTGYSDSSGKTDTLMDAVANVDSIVKANGLRLDHLLNDLPRILMNVFHAYNLESGVTKEMFNIEMTEWNIRFVRVRVETNIGHWQRDIGQMLRDCDFGQMRLARMESSLESSLARMESSLARIEHGMNLLLQHMGINQNNNTGQAPGQDSLCS